MALLNTLQLSEAFSRGHQHWKASLSQWGNLGTGTDATSTGYQINRPVVGCQIASDSDVAECGIMFDAGFGFPVETPYSTILDDRMYIRRGQPYFWRTPSEVYVYPTEESCYYDVFSPCTVGQSTDFGGALHSWVAPTLRIIFFLDDTLAARAEPPRVRIPDERTIQNVPYGAELLDGAGVFPIQHRRNLRLQVYAAQANVLPYQIRICGTIGKVTPPGTAAAQRELREFTMTSSPYIFSGEKSGIAGFVRAGIPLQNVDANWLLLYPMLMAGGAGATGTIQVQLFAD